MRFDAAPRVINAERVSDGVIIMFDDGKCALYSPSVLLDTFYRAKEVVLLENQDSEEGRGFD